MFCDEHGTVDYCPQCTENSTKMLDLFNEILDLKKKFAKENHHRLEVCISSDMDEWICEFGLEAWAASLCEGRGKNPMEAFDKAVKKLEI